MSKYTIRSKEPSEPLLEHWKPHGYQVTGMEFLLKNGGAGLFLDPGLGKTSITLGAVRVLLKENQCKRVLIIAPLRVAHLVWPAEIEKWAEFKHIRVVVLHGPKKDELIKQDADVYVINPAGLEWLMSGGRFTKLKPDVLIIDESSQFKNTKSQRYKLIKPHLPKFRRRWILTGTPAPNGLLDLFGQVHLMDMGHAFGPYISRYRATYFSPGASITKSVMSATGEELQKKIVVGWAPQPGAEEMIYEKLAPYVLRIDAKDHIDIPAIVEHDIWIDLPKEARRVYDQIEEEMVSEIGGSLVTAVSAASASIKCRQIASGGLYKQYEVDELDRPRNREVIHLHDEKTQAVIDLVEELQGKPLLVAYEFEHDLQRLREAFGKDLPYIGGGVSTKTSAAIEKAWNEGSIPVLAGHPRSMGHGLNFQKSGNRILWYTPTWDAELYEQLNRRLARQGSKHGHIIVGRVAARDTVDVAVLRACGAKIKNQNALLNALRDYSEQRIKLRG